MGVYGYVDIKCSDPDCDFELTGLAADLKSYRNTCPKCHKKLNFYVWYR